MTEQGGESPSLSSGKAFRVIFLFLGIIGGVIAGAWILILIVNFLLLPIEPSALVQNPVDLTMKAMNIVLVFFTIVAALLAFFGFREAGMRQKMREEDIQLHQRLSKEGEELADVREELKRETEKRREELKRETQYMNKLNSIRIFVQLGNYDKASYVLSEIKESFSWEVPFFRAMVSGEQRNYQDALRHLEEVLRFHELKPREKARVYFVRGSIYMLMNDWKKADLNYDKCLELAPDYLGSYVNKAHICKRQGNFDGAIELLNRAVKINERESICYFNRACYYSQKDEKTKMEDDLKEAFKLDRKWVYHALFDDDLSRNKDVVKKLINC